MLFFLAIYGACVWLARLGWTAFARRNSSGKGLGTQITVPKTRDGYPAGNLLSYTIIHLLPHPEQLVLLVCVSIWIFQ